MTTPGALSGTGVFLRMRISDGSWQSIGGQLSHSETLTNELIEITNKIGDPGYRELLPDEGRQNTSFSVEVLFVSQSGFDFVRSIAGTKEEATLQVLRENIASGVVFLWFRQWI